MHIRKWDEVKKKKGFVVDYQRLRNLTTGRLHTRMEHIYEDLEFIIGEEGLMTHMLPNVNKAVEPWLREQVTDPKFWEDVHDPSHTGEYPLRAMTKEESAEVLKRYAALPSLLAGKNVVGISV